MHIETTLLHIYISNNIYVELCAKTGYLPYGQVITYPCNRYPVLAQDFTLHSKRNVLYYQSMCIIFTNILQVAVNNINMALQTDNTGVFSSMKAV